MCKTFFRALISLASLALVCSIFSLIRSFYNINFLFSAFKFLNLSWRSLMSRNYSLSPPLSCMTESMNFSYTVCLCMNACSSFKAYFFSFRIIFSSNISFSLSLIYCLSLFSFSSSVFLLSECC